MRHDGLLMTSDAPNCLPHQVLGRHHRGAVRDAHAAARHGALRQAHTRAPGSPVRSQWLRPEAVATGAEEGFNHGGGDGGGDGDGGGGVSIMVEKGFNHGGGGGWRRRRWQRRRGDGGRGGGGFARTRPSAEASAGRSSSTAGCNWCSIYRKGSAQCSACEGRMHVTWPRCPRVVS